MLWPMIHCCNPKQLLTFSLRHSKVKVLRRGCLAMVENFFSKNSAGPKLNCYFFTSSFAVSDAGSALPSICFTLQVGRWEMGGIMRLSIRTGTTPLMGWTPASEAAFPPNSDSCLPVFELWHPPRTSAKPTATPPTFWCPCTNKGLCWTLKCYDERQCRFKGQSLLRNSVPFPPWPIMLMQTYKFEKLQSTVGKFQFG